MRKMISRTRTTYSTEFSLAVRAGCLKSPSEGRAEPARFAQAKLREASRPAVSRPKSPERDSSSANKNGGLRMTTWQTSAPMSRRAAQSNRSKQSIYAPVFGERRSQFSAFGAQLSAVSVLPSCGLNSTGFTADRLLPSERRRSRGRDLRPVRWSAGLFSDS